MRTIMILMAVSVIFPAAILGCGGASVRNAKPASLDNPRWMSMRESVGKMTGAETAMIFTGRDVLLTVRAEGIAEGTPAVFRIRSRRSDQERMIDGKVTGGRAEAVWRAECLEPLSSIRKEETVSYTFTCEVNGIRSAESAPAGLNFVCRVTVMGPEDLSGFRSSYELRSEDGSYRKRIMVADSVSRENDPCTHILEFAGVEPGLAYRLDFFAENGASPDRVKENASFAEIME